MSIVTSGEAGGSLSSGNYSNNSEQQDHHHHHHHHQDQELIVEKQELSIDNDHNSNHGQYQNQNQNLHGSINSLSSTTTLSNGSTTQLPPSAKKKRNPPGNPDPSADVIALSPNTLMAKNRFVCEICSKGFQRDQNLQLHRRGHNLPWKLRQRNANEVIKKRVYICPDASCVHHNPARALGDLTGIKKHFSRKHGEKKWKCDRCNKKYAVQSDWKAHSKTCGTREYKCECGTIFSRRDSFITHRAFCDAIAEENSKTTMVGQIPSVERHVTTQISNRSDLVITNDINTIINDNNNVYDHQAPQEPIIITGSNNTNNTPYDHHYYHNHSQGMIYGHGQNDISHFMSATALLQKAAQMGHTGGGGGGSSSVMAPPSFGSAHHHQNHVNSVGFFGGLLLGHHHQSHAGDKNDVVVLHGANSGTTSSTTTGGGDVMTVDFLGIGRSQKQVNVNNMLNDNNNNNNLKQLERDHHNNQVIMRFDEGDLSQFEQHDHGIIGKHVWEV